MDVMLDFNLVTTEAQIQQTADLAREIWTEHFTPIIGADQVAYMLANIQSAEAMTRQIQQDGYRYYQIVKDEQFIGYTAVQVREDALFLSKLYILKAHRGNGYARKSLEFIESLARQNSLKRITLTCNKYNTGTIKAYEKMGFTNTGSVVMDIGGDFVMDDYTLEKPLD